MRISNEVLEKLNDLDDLIKIMGENVGDFDEFKRRFVYFKEEIKETLSELTIEEILKFDEYFNKLQELYKFHGYYYLFAALEFEQRKQNK